MAPKRKLPPVDLGTLVSSSSASSPANGPQEDKEVTVRATILNTVSFKAKASETMKNVVALIKQKEDALPAPIQELLISGKHVEEGHIMGDYITAGNSIIDVFCRESTISITVERITVDDVVSTGLKVKMSDTVLLIKSMIDFQEGTKSAEYELFFRGNQLQDNMTIGNSGLKDDSVLYNMVFSPMDSFPIRIALPCGRIVRLTVKALHTIFDLKVFLQKSVEAPIDQWHLSRSRAPSNDDDEDDEALENSESNAYYGLESYSLLHAIFPNA